MAASAATAAVANIISTTTRLPHIPSPTKPFSIFHSKPLQKAAQHVTFLSKNKNKNNPISKNSLYDLDFDYNDDKLREECGVVGIYGDKEAPRLCSIALHALQHRGQEGAGIVSVHDSLIQSATGTGLVSEVFFKDPAILNQLHGELAIGHVRYSTEGSSMLINVQPFVSKDKKFSVAHNGNFTNYKSLRLELEVEHGSVFVTSSDSELVLRLIEVSEKESFVLKIMDACEKLEGAFSLVFCSEDGKLVAVRDPLGFRPLVMGRTRNGGVAFASETCALDKIKATYVRDVQPGEVIVVDSNVEEIQSYQMISRGETKFCTFEHIYFAHPSSVVFGRSVYESRRIFGECLAEVSPVDCDVVIPVPDSGLSAAMGYAKRAGVQFEFGLIKSAYMGRTFIEPDQEIRDLRANMKLSVVRTVVEGKRVVVVDDSIVRGTTAPKLVQMLRDGGAKEIHIRIASPPVIGPCRYGVDTPESDKLIANKMNKDEMTKYIGADSLEFLPIEKLQSYTGENDENKYCYACYTGIYPVKVKPTCNCE